MTLAALAPAAAVAGLLIPLGLVTALIAADPTPPLTAKPPVIVQATPATPGPTVAATTPTTPVAAEPWAWLERRVTCDFKNAPWSEMVQFVHRTTSGNLLLDPALGQEPGTITLRVKEFATRDLLQWCESISGLKHVQTHGVYLLYRGDEPPAVGAGCDLAGAAADPALAARLDRRVTLEWRQVDAQTAFDDLRRQLALNLVVAPAALPLLRQARLTLSVADMRLDHLLAWTCHLSGFSLRLADGALQLDRAGAEPATKGDVPRF